MASPQPQEVVEAVMQVLTIKTSKTSASCPASKNGVIDVLRLPRQAGSKAKKRSERRREFRTAR